MFKEQIKHRSSYMNFSAVTGKGKNSYKYCRCCSWPSSGPRVPETLELPKSLKSKKDYTTD